MKTKMAKNKITYDEINTHTHTHTTIPEILAKAVSYKKWKV